MVPASPVPSAHSATAQPRTQKHHSREDLRDFRIAALVDDHFEQIELTAPQASFEAAGARVDLISPQAQLTGLRHLTPADHFTPDVLLSEANTDDYDALLLPGGVVNADQLRLVPAARRFARSMVEHAKPVAVICHGGWLLISAGLVHGRTLTSWPSLEDDYRNAGARWVNEPVVIDGHWVSSRKPDDIPVFNAAAIEVFRAYHDHRRAA